MTALKDKYARGENKKRLAGIMEVYPRPTFKANIAGFIGMKVKQVHVVSNEEDLAMEGLLAMSNDKNNEADDDEVGF